MTLMAAAAMTAQALAQAQAPKRSARGEFEVSVESRLDPLSINRLHAWVATVRDRQGRAVESARIDIDGAVPGLDRHMPTAPRVTKALGDGRFQIDGVKFDMAGRWRLRLRIDADGVSDSVEFDILVK